MLAAAVGEEPRNHSTKPVNPDWLVIIGIGEEMF
jgi:hypothetical protein